MATTKLTDQFRTDEEFNEIESRKRPEIIVVKEYKSSA